MLKSFVIFLLSTAFIATQVAPTKANECALNTECRHIQDCPRILQNFHLIRKKPFCNLNQNETYVCCLKPSTKYNQDKDKDFRSVKECKSYQNLRATCTKKLIVCGNEAEPKQFPFVALLIYKTAEVFKPLCVGTLISNKFVLTAAHCFYHTNSPNTVRLGELDWSVTTDIAAPVDFEIKNTFIHPQYFTSDIQELYHDIALVELAQQVVFSEFIMPACLPLLDGREFNQFMTAGWGYPNDTTTKIATRMLKLKLDRFDDETCISKVEQTEVLENGVNISTQMCAGLQKYTTGACSGLSGSPLFVDHPDYNCLFLVVGITSFGQGGCSNIDQPTVFTRIQWYLDWIEQIVWKESNKLL